MLEALAKIVKGCFAQNPPRKEKAPVKLEITVSEVQEIICEKVDRCLQFFGIKVFDQFLFWG